MLKNCWVKDGINWFILNEDGSMKADELLVIDGDLYYFRSWGAVLYNSWHMDAAGNLYYFRDWGGAFHDQTVTIDGKEYVFDSSWNGVLKEEPEEIKVTEITVSGQTEMYVGDTQKLASAAFCRVRPLLILTFFGVFH